MITRLGRCLRDIRTVFAELNLRWYLFGAQAAIAHGIVRSTVDIDVTVDARAVETRELARRFVRHQFRLKFDDENFIRQTRVLALFDKRGVPVDVVLGGGGFDDLFLARTRKYKRGGVIVPVAAPEDVVAMKVLAQRPIDLKDVDELLHVNRTIRVDRVRDTLVQLEQALDQSDLLTSFEGILAKVRR